MDTRFFMALLTDGRVKICSIVVVDENEDYIEGYVDGDNSTIRIIKPYLVFKTIVELKDFYRKSLD